MKKKPKPPKPEITVRSRTRNGLTTNIWNKLKKGYITDNHTWFENEYWCVKMILKRK